jgi:RNA polymerase sigma factor (sigma-70 family)
MVMSRPSPEEMMIRDDDNQALFAALAKLNDKERNIVAMKYAANLTNTVIADLLGISGSHVGVVLYRSLKKLHKELERGGFHL